MANQLKLGSISAPTLANGGISPGCIAVFPCRQAVTDSGLADISGNGNTGVAGGAFVSATAFASPQGILTADAAATDTTCNLPLAKFTYSHNANDTLLISTRIKLAALPGSARPIWAQGGNNTSAQGLSLRVTVSGAMVLVLDGPATQLFSSNTDSVLTASVWQSVTFALWGMDVAAGTGCYGIWINGAPATTSTPKFISGWPAVVTPVEALRIGQYYRTAGPTTLSLGATQSDFHVYRSPKAVIWTQAQMTELANRLYRDPSRPLSATEWRMS